MIGILKVGGIMVEIEELNDKNEKQLLFLSKGSREDEFVEDVEYTIKLSHYGTVNNLDGFCCAIKYNKEYVGIILVGLALLDELDPVEIREKEPFRIIGFFIDENYRNQGIGSVSFQMSLDKFYSEYGIHPIILDCHKENDIAYHFYRKFGFHDTGTIRGNDKIMVKLK